MGKRLRIRRVELAGLAVGMLLANGCSGTIGGDNGGSAGSPGGAVTPPGGGGGSGPAGPPTPSTACPGGPQAASLHARMLLASQYDNTIADLFKIATLPGAAGPV